MSAESVPAGLSGSLGVPGRIGSAEEAAPWMT